ncbi:MAG TPA: zinc-binding dehydrogenase [Pseudorhizobium sp.]|jgi:NADPH2:quinone reductase|nr:zinc-binding dehydrogenase [Pseudorhizobium sp.]
MKAVVVEAPGGLDRLAIQEVPEPNLPHGHVLVEVAWAACNWGDVQKRQGIYPDPVSYPAILGGEVSGRIIKRGAGVRGFTVGQNVAAITGRDMLRGFAQRVAVAQELLMPVPTILGLRVAAAYPVVSLTAYHLLNTAAKIRAGETILIHAIGGGVGLALLQLSRHAGAQVLGTVSTSEKARLPIDLGADRVIARDSEDFVEVAMEVTQGRGVDLVIDSLGADILPRSFDALRPFGHLINIGEAAGEPHFDVRKKLYERSTSFAGFELIHAEPGSRGWRASVRKVARSIETGRLRIPIAGELPMERIGEAHALLESGRVSGKLLIEVGGTNEYA